MRWWRKWLGNWPWRLECNWEPEYQGGILRLGQEFESQNPAPAEGDDGSARARGRKNLSCNCHHDLAQEATS